MLATVIPFCQHKQVAQNIYNQIRKPFRATSKVALHCVWLNFAFDMIQFLDTTPCASVTMCIVHVHGMCEAGVHCWFSGNPKNNTKLQLIEDESQAVTYMFYAI